MRGNALKVRVFLFAFLEDRHYHGFAMIDPNTSLICHGISPLVGVQAKLASRERKYNSVALASPQTISLPPRQVRTVAGWF